MVLVSTYWQIRSRWLSFPARRLSLSHFGSFSRCVQSRDTLSNTSTSNTLVCVAHDQSPPDLLDKSAHLLALEWEHENMRDGEVHTS